MASRHQYGQEAYDPYAQPTISSQFPTPDHGPLRPAYEKENTQSSWYAVPSNNVEPKYHSFTTILIVFWTAVVVATVALLERSVAVAPTVVALPWYYSNDGLPNILSTIFAQAHGPVTAMHLSRLSISGLQTAIGAPATWMELFWMADKNWSGPFGIAGTGWTAFNRRIRVSVAFVLFSFITILTLVTPLVLSRAYPIKTLDVTVPQTFFPNTLSTSRLAGIDAYAQLAAGAGAWATNQSAIHLFNQTSYIPTGQIRGDNSNDYFFAGDAQNLDVSLPGVRIRGGCNAVDHTDLSDFSLFITYCKSQLDTMAFARNTTIDGNSIGLEISTCANVDSFQPFDQSATSNSSTFIWFQNTNTTGMMKGDLVTGLVRCDALTLFGNASLNGREATFDQFIPDKLYNATQAGEPLLDPVAAVLFYTLTSYSGDTGSAAQAGAIDQLGYAESGLDGGLFYTSPSLDGFANAMWSGITHMTVAMAILSRSSNVAYSGIAHVPVSGRTRDQAFFLGAMALLVLWFLGVVCATATMFRPTVSDSLDSYPAARLLAGRPDLVRGDNTETLTDNERLLERFEPVGQGKDSGVGHFAQGGVLS